MTLTPTSLLFFDASCLFAAAASPTGGSAYLVSVCSWGHLRAAVSVDVLIKAERNILEKLSVEAFIRYRELLKSTPFLVTLSPPELTVSEYVGVFVEDAHVVAAALAVQADYLVTLDRRLAHRVTDADLGIVALSPRDFLQNVFPRHPDYARIRQRE